MSVDSGPLSVANETMRNDNLVARTRFDNLRAYGFANTIADLTCLFVILLRYQASVDEVSGLLEPTDY